MAAPALLSVTAQRLPDGSYSVRLTQWPELRRPPRVSYLAHLPAGTDRLESVLVGLAQAAQGAALDAGSVPHVAL